MQQQSVYLFGPLLGRTFRETIYWRKYAAQLLAPEIETFSPTRGLVVDDPNEDFHEQYEFDIMHTQKGFTTRDSHDIAQTNGMLGDFSLATKASIGSMIELGIASTLHKPIVLVVPDDNIHNHPMVREMALVVPTLEIGVHAIQSFLLPGSVLQSINLEQRIEEWKRFSYNTAPRYWTVG